MADIFFGKFSELVSKEQGVKKINEEKRVENKTPHKKKPQNKILIYSSIAILLAVAIYLICWIA